MNLRKVGATSVAQKSPEVPSIRLEGHGCPAQVPHGFSSKTYGGKHSEPWTVKLRMGSGKERNIAVSLRRNECRNRHALSEANGKR